jgi:hypothetical protein
MDLGLQDNLACCLTLLFLSFTLFLLSLHANELLPLIAAIPPNVHVVPPLIVATLLESLSVFCPATSPALTIHY